MWKVYFDSPMHVYTIVRKIIRHQFNPLCEKIKLKNLKVTLIIIVIRDGLPRVHKRNRINFF